MPSYEKRESGLWSVRFTIFDGPKEKTKRLSGFDTKRAAREGYEKFMAENIVQKRRILTPVDSFDDLVISFLDHLQCKESTKLAYESRIRMHILPYFGGRKTHEIQPVDVLDWMQTLSALSFEYKKTLRGNLHAIFRFGNQYYGTQNPVEAVDGFRDTGDEVKEMLVWNKAEYDQFIAAVDSPVYHALFRFLFSTGCRIGEALALCKGDIDRRTCRVNVCKSVTRVTKDADYKITTPKNKYSVRKIEIPRGLVDELMQLPDGPFLFSGPAPLHPNSVRNNLKRYQKIAGVQQIRLHDLRHSHASLLLSQHVAITAVSRRLGHKNPQITLSIYAHMLPEDIDTIRSAIGDL